MGFTKKIWKDRISEFPARRNLTKENGDTELVTVARSEGSISQEGDAFSAENMNGLEERIGSGFDEVNSNLSVKSIGNAVSATGWDVTASNVVINNIGILFGTIVRNADGAPNWGETIATYPNFKSPYNIPVLLFCTDGSLFVTANIETTGAIRVFGPDFDKLNQKGKAYHFSASYFAGK